MKKAFTLSEVLITLGIIGIVAAISMHLLVIKYQERIRITKIKQFYSQISNAYIAIHNSSGQYSAMYELSAPEYSNQIIKDFCDHLKCEKIFWAQNFPSNEINNFINNDQGRIYLLDGTLYENTLGHEHRAMAVLSNGNIFLIRGYLATENSFRCLPHSNNNGADTCFLIELVIDKKKLQYGKSIFGFYAFKDVVLPAGSLAGGYYNSFEDLCLTKGKACTGWIIQNDNMDYLHCPEKLGWNKARSCKN